MQTYVPAFKAHYILRKKSPALLGILKIYNCLFETAFKSRPALVEVIPTRVNGEEQANVK